MSTFDKIYTDCDKLMVEARTTLKSSLYYKPLQKQTEETAETAETEETGETEEETGDKGDGAAGTIKETVELLLVLKEPAGGLLLLVLQYFQDQFVDILDNMSSVEASDADDSDLDAYMKKQGELWGEACGAFTATYLPALLNAVTTCKEAFESQETQEK
eukprot:Platyproteum_vivax@DN8075_c0_g1_i1.p1